MLRRNLLAALAMTALAACAPKTEQKPELSISDAWIRVPPGGRDITAGYLKVVNAGGADRLISAHADGAKYVELHTHVEKDGMMHMEQVSHVDIPAGSTITFQPGGLHLMMFGVDKWEPGKMVPITLVFAKSGEKHVDAMVKLPTSKPVHGMGH